MQEVSELAEKVFILKNGKIAASGTQSEIINKFGAKSLEDAFVSLSESGEGGF